MGLLSRFEGKMEDGLEGAAGTLFKAPISPVQIAKNAEKAMRREKMVGAGKQYAPTLYTVLVNPMDDQRLFGYYPTLAGETETYLSAKAAEDGLLMDGQPLVRFIVDEGLRRGKFDIVAELVSAPIIAQLRHEEMTRYGLAGKRPAPAAAAAPATPRPVTRAATPQPQPKPQPAHEPLPYIPEEEIDRSINYGEYTFNSSDFDGNAAPAAENDLSGLDSFTGAASSEPLPQEHMPAVAGPTRVLGDEPRSAPQPQPAYNQVVNAFLVNTTTNRSYPLDRQRMILGRSSGSNIVLDDINASRHHAELRCEPNGAWSITDLGSTNGTTVNDMSITTHILREGDRISIGVTNFVFTRN